MWFFRCCKKNQDYPSEQQPLIQNEPTPQSSSNHQEPSVQSYSSVKKSAVYFLAIGYTVGSICLYGNNVLKIVEIINKSLTEETKVSEILWDTSTLTSIAVTFFIWLFPVFRDKLKAVSQSNFTFGGSTIGFFKGVASSCSGREVALRYKAPRKVALIIGIILGIFYALAEGALYSAEERKRNAEGITLMSKVRSCLTWLIGCLKPERTKETSEETDTLTPSPCNI